MREYRSPVHKNVDVDGHAIHKIPLKYSNEDNVRADDASITRVGYRNAQQRTKKI